jgi:DNA-binding beta-propeller fold protein YncE
MVGLLVVGVNSPAVALADTGEEKPIFYPPPPDLPRLQFLTKFSSALDTTTKSKGFRDFVFGGEEYEAQLINKPYGLAIYKGAIFVVDARGNGWGVFDVANDDARLVKPIGAGALKKPINMTIDEDGTRYVTDSDRGQIVVFDAQDRFLAAFGKPGQLKPVDVAIAGDRLYVTDVKQHKVHILDKNTGEITQSFGGAGNKPGQFLHPTNLAFGSDGILYVTDTNNFRVQKFNGDGELIGTFGKAGSGAGHFARPKGIALDREGHAYVVDAAFENLQVIHPDGGALMAFGQPGIARDNINMPTVVKIDYDNVSYFEKYAAPDFELEYLVLVASQFGLNKVVVFGYGQLRE